MGLDTKKLEYWGAHYKSWQTSGLTQRAYCEREALSLPSFERWNKRVRSNAKAGGDKNNTPVAGATRPLTLVPVQVSDGRGEGQLVLRNGSGWQLTMPTGVDSQWLAALMRGMA